MRTRGTMNVFEEFPENFEHCEAPPPPPQAPVTLE
jgi:hypothetical protein